MATIITLVKNSDYIGNVSASKFYYKKDIFDYYHMSYLTPFLPIEIVNNILSYICSSLIVYAKKKTIYYLNPKDKAIIKSIKLKKIKLGYYDNNNYYAISEDGLTFYSIYQRHMEIEYLCEEKPDHNKPKNKQTNTNRYYYSYNIAKKCKISAQLMGKTPFNSTIILSKNGKYILVCPKSEYIIDKSNAYIAIYEAKTKTFIKEIKINTDAVIELLSVSPDNNFLIAIGYWYNYHMYSKEVIKNTIWIWNINTGKQLSNYDTLLSMNNRNVLSNYHIHIAWNPSSSKFAISYFLNKDRFILFGNLTDIYINKFQGKYLNITWLNDNKIACYSSKDNDNTIFIKNWNIDDEEIIHLSNINRIRTFQNSMDGNIIISHSRTYDDGFSDDESSDDEQSTCACGCKHESKDDELSIETVYLNLNQLSFDIDTFNDLFI